MIASLSCQLISELPKLFPEKPGQPSTHRIMTWWWSILNERTANMFSPLVDVPNLRVFDFNTMQLVPNLNILSPIGIFCPKLNHICPLPEFVVGPQKVSFVLNMIAYVLDNATVLI